MRASRCERLRSPARARLDEQRARVAFTAVVDAVMAVYAAGKLHRDLKPQNVLVTPEHRVVVLDFGLALDLVGDRAASSVEGRAVGTPAYMAPEQACGAAVGPAADWYSVGVMLYQALTGQLPFSGSWRQLLDEKLTRDPVHPSSLAPGCPADLADLAMALTVRDPAARPDGAILLARLRGHRRTAGARTVGDCWQATRRLRRSPARDERLALASGAGAQPGAPGRAGTRRLGSG